MSVKNAKATGLKQGAINLTANQRHQLLNVKIAALLTLKILTQKIEDFKEGDEILQRNKVL